MMICLVTTSSIIITIKKEWGLFSNLVEEFVNRNIITTDTEIYAYYYGYDVSGIMKTKVKGIFTVDEIMRENNRIRFKVSSTRDGEVKVISSDDIIEIDGMNPKRLAKSYNINSDGTNMVVGKKRGRKPKRKDQA